MLPTDRATPGEGRRLLQASGLAILFLIYCLYEFPEYLAGNVKYAGMLVLSLLLMGVFAALCFDSTLLQALGTLVRNRDANGKRALLLLVIGMASITHFNSVLLSHRVYVQARILDLPVNVPSLATWAVFTGAALFLLIKVPAGNTPIFALAMTWGVLLRILSLATVRFDPEAADMLYCIDRACDSLLHGINPYSQTYSLSPTHSFPLVYFPLLWLPYLPFKALGLDIRWFNILAQAGLFSFVWYLIGRRDRGIFRSAILIVLIFMPDMIWTMFYRQMSHYWLVGCVFLWLVSRDRWKLSLLAVTGMVAMRLTALTMLGIYLVYVWKRRGFRIAVLDGALAFCGVILTLLPFAGVGFKRLFYVFFGIFASKSAQLTWDKPLSNLAVGGLLERFGVAHLLMPLQALGVLAIGLIYLASRDRSYRTFGMFAALAYAYFLWVAGYVFVYYWFMPILTVAVVYLIDTRNAPAACEPATLRPAEIAPVQGD